MQDSLKTMLKGGFAVQLCVVLWMEKSTQTFPSLFIFTWKRKLCRNAPPAFQKAFHRDLTCANQMCFDTPLLFKLFQEWTVVFVSDFFIISERTHHWQVFLNTSEETTEVYLFQIWQKCIDVFERQIGLFESVQPVWAPAAESQCCDLFVVLRQSEKLNSERLCSAVVVAEEWDMGQLKTAKNLRLHLFHRHKQWHLQFPVHALDRERLSTGRKENSESVCVSLKEVFVALAFSSSNMCKLIFSIRIQWPSTSCPCCSWGPSVGSVMGGVTCVSSLSLMNFGCF